YWIQQLEQWQDNPQNHSVWQGRSLLGLLRDPVRRRLIRMLMIDPSLIEEHRRVLQEVFPDLELPSLRIRPLKATRRVVLQEQLVLALTSPQSGEGRPPLSFSEAAHLLRDNYLDAPSPVVLERLGLAPEERSLFVHEETVRLSLMEALMGLHIENIIDGPD